MRLKFVKIRKLMKTMENQKLKNILEKKQQISQQPNFKPPKCPSCKRKYWLEIDEGYYCRNCECIIQLLR